MGPKNECEIAATEVLLYIKTHKHGHQKTCPQIAKYNTPTMSVYVMDKSVSRLWCTRVATHQYVVVTGLLQTDKTDRQTDRQ